MFWHVCSNMTRESVVIDKEKILHKIHLYRPNSRTRYKLAFSTTKSFNVSGLNVTYNAIKFETSYLQVQKTTRFKMPHLQKMSSDLLSARQGKHVFEKINIIDVVQSCYFKGYTALFSEKSCDTQTTAATEQSLKNDDSQINAIIRLSTCDVLKLSNIIKKTLSTNQYLTRNI